MAHATDDEQAVDKVDRRRMRRPTPPKRYCFFGGVTRGLISPAAQHPDGSGMTFSTDN
jgi:hypothetical protein